MRFRRSAILAFMAAALTACADGVTVTREQSITPLLDIHLRMIGSVGEVQTLVRNNPFPQDRDSTAVRAAMATNSIWPPVRFVADRPAADPYGYRIMVAFGTWPVGGDSYCRNPNLTPQAAGVDVTAVHAVFCVGSSVLSEAAAHTRRVAAPDDVRFRELMSQLLLALFNSYQRLDVVD